MKNELILDIVNQIQTDCWRQFFRKRPTGIIAKGWAKRLHHYTWSTKSAPDFFNHLVWLDQITKEASVGETLINATQRHSARCKIAKDILVWGGVTRGNIAKVPHVIDEVIDAVHTGTPSKDAPMNSGWTKIAAVYSLVMPNAPQQIIWDSRVSLSICKRLGIAAQSLGLSTAELQKTFGCRLGWVAGRGGNRPKLQVYAQKWFPSRYGKWEAHFEGGAVVAEMAKILNANMSTYGTPCDALTNHEHSHLKKLGIEPPQKWTPWLVACVLFMDGY